VLDGEGVPTMADVWRGRLVEVAQLGADVKLVVDSPGTKEQVG